MFLLKFAWRDLRGSGRSLWIFCACLMLGVTLVAATGSLYRIVNAAMQADTRALLGGDVEVDTNAPLPDKAIKWMNDRGQITLVRELYTMLGNADGEFIRVELQSMDEHYPLYGELELSPAMSLSEATRVIDNTWGLAIDESLSQRHNISVGDRVFVGELEMAVRALVITQPDRNLTAQWRGSPVLVADNAIEAAGLTGPDSRIDYDYKVATDLPAEAWRDQFYRQFSDEGWDVRTFQNRSARIADRLGKIASGLMIIAVSTLFIGGLGVFSSVRTHLQGKLKTIATLRSLGLRDGRLTKVYLLQIAILSAGASFAGCLLGSLLAWGGSTVVASELRLTITMAALYWPLIIAFLFGCLTAFAFALPAIGRALSVSPATLFRSDDQISGNPSRPFIIASTVVIALLVICIFVTLPDPLFASGFVVVVLLLIGSLEVLLLAIRKLAKWIDKEPRSSLRFSFSLRLAMANLHRRESPLRSTILSLGSALTVLVACTLVVTSLLRTVYATIPESAPALVLYDIETDQVAEVVKAAQQSENQARVETAPLVRARIASVNDVTARQLLIAGDNQLRRAINNEHKLSYRGGNIDGLDLVDGQWWTPGTTNVMSLEDREASRLGISVGDQISYQISDKTPAPGSACDSLTKGVANPLLV